MQKLFTQRMLKIALIIIVGLSGFLFVLNYGLGKFNQWKGEQKVKKLAEALKKIEEVDYELALADIYGGKTPEETLQMYIIAVEKGDYKLASKYLIIPKQEEEYKNLKSAPHDNIQEFIDILKKASLINMTQEINEGYEIGRATMEVKFDSGPSMHIDFWKYPSGNWKIEEF